MKHGFWRRFPGRLCRAALAGAFLTGWAGAGEQVPAKANSHPVYVQLRGLPLSGESSAVSSLTLKRQTARITFRNGRFHFLAPVEGRVTGAVFVGDGLFQLEPREVSEKRQLGLLTGEPALSEEFNKMMLRFTDSTYDEIVGASEAGASAADSTARGVLEDGRKLFRKRRTYQRPNVAAGFTPYNLDARILVDLMRSDGEGYFLAQFDGKRHGDQLFVVDPLGLPFVTPEEVAWVNLSQDKLGIWVSSHLAGHGVDSPASDESHELIDVQRQTIDARLDKDKLEATASTRFVATREGIRAVPFDLFSTLRVSRITDEAGNELSFVQEDKEEDADLVVILEQPLKKGESATLRFEYAGDKALSDSGGGNYTLVARSSWYPSNTFGDRTEFDITLRAPKKLEVVATGDLVEEKEEGDLVVSHWKSAVPLGVAGFNYGQFKKERTVDKEVGFTIDTYANKYIPDYLKGLQHAVDQFESRTGQKTGMTIGSLNTTSMMDRARSEAQTAIRLFSGKFGPLPYRRLAMTQQPAPNFGQAWPMLVYMPLSAFLDSTFRHQIFNDTGGSFFKYVAAHEVAHQWWGHTLGWKSYRDQWMSEGFAEFSASLFAQLVYGNDKFRDFWKELREQILDKNRYGYRPADVGPVTQGYRLDTAKTGYPTRDMIYPKGAFILHMLRMLMWNPQEGDAKFDAMMQDFVESNFNREVSTADFQAAVERHMTPQMNLGGDGKMDWFFRQWVYGTEIPRYKLEYRLEDMGGGKTKLIGKVTQSGVSDSFAMAVPIYVDFGKGDPVRLGSSNIFGNGSTPEFEVALPKKPKAVVLCWFEDVLAEIEN